jgi:hypothetical protein
LNRRLRDSTRRPAAVGTGSQANSKFVGQSGTPQRRARSALDIRTAWQLAQQPTSAFSLLCGRAKRPNQRHLLPSATAVVGFIAALNSALARPSEELACRLRSLGKCAEQGFPLLTWFALRHLKYWWHTRVCTFWHGYTELKVVMYLADAALHHHTHGAFAASVWGTE